MEHPAVRPFLTLVLTAALMWGLYREEKSGSLKKEHAVNENLRYAPQIAACLLPSFICVVGLVLLLVGGVEVAAHNMFALCFQAFSHTAVYFALLLPAMPLLRRWFQARTCALLWLLPNYLYIMLGNTLLITEPRWVITAPWGGVEWVMAVWAAGMAAVLGWKILGHLRFRAHILGSAWEEDDSAVLRIWYAEQKDAGYDDPCLVLVRSPLVHTPLSIGFFRSTIRVVLPERAYTAEELALIFRHEIVHINRQDSKTKFFMALCAAMCWFNPLMWVAMGRSAEDMELSCDEAVLQGADEATCRRYGELLLSTAGDERGFTTCLAASAKSMRYRLRSVVQPRERAAGALAVGVIFFLLMITGGQVALAYGAVTWEEALDVARDGCRVQLSSAYLWDDGTEWECEEAPRALLDYLHSRTFHRLTSFRTPFDEGPVLRLTYRGERFISISLSEHNLTVFSPRGERKSTTYYLVEPVDWDYIHSLMGEP